ncbi:MAG: cupin domain-containing protein [Frateuria sp.]|uniref:cupin domain-containing protein n=1 Tax=Frateuria sp. TaxID=2211372 RepID=UPI00183230A2|nr:cupin domain-containing protein [Frateuria sp.]NUO73846.1 cupin domain-containing protein [Frateuria sp.]NUR23166.1 cupin domain-containing protein [Frateuria sp.]
MPKIDPSSAPERRGSGYPAPYAQAVQQRVRWALGDAGGLSDFGVNLSHLPPGCWSSQRHWHTHEEEFVYVLSGELVLVTDEGEQPLCAGECAAFPKNVANGHHLVNRGSETAVLLEIGTRSDEDACRYPDIDLYVDRRGWAHADGTPY